nr:MAG TPA: hypothetical protein [Caudoviricetes sp.]DAZ83262.1 MAG TPA: hypothetical protein [Caudoviricetes sp.]
MLVRAALKHQGLAVPSRKALNQSIGASWWSW